MVSVAQVTRTDSLPYHHQAGSGEFPGKVVIYRFHGGGLDQSGQLTRPDFCREGDHCRAKILMFLLAAVSNAAGAGNSANLPAMSPMKKVAPEITVKNIANDFGRAYRSISQIPMARRTMPPPPALQE